MLNTTFDMWALRKGTACPRTLNNGSLILNKQWPKSGPAARLGNLLLFVHGNIRLNGCLRCANMKQQHRDQGRDGNNR